MSFTSDFRAAVLGAKTNNTGEVGAALFLREEAGIHRARSGKSTDQLSGLTSSPKEQGGPTAQEEICPPTSQQGHLRPEPAHHTGWGVWGVCVCVCVYARTVLAAFGPRPQGGTFL